MYYRNDEQNINKDGGASYSKDFDENFYNEAYDYPCIGFPPMMYNPLMCTPQDIPTNAEYDDYDDPDDEFDGYRLARSPRHHRPHHNIHHHIHHHYIHHSMTPKGKK